MEHGQADQPLVGVLPQRETRRPDNRNGPGNTDDGEPECSARSLQCFPPAALRKISPRPADNFARSRRIGYRCQAGLTLGTNSGRNHSRDSAECGGVSSRDFSAPRQIRFQLLQLRDTQGTGNIRQAIVETQQDHFILPLARALPLARIAADSVIAEAAQGLREVRDCWWLPCRLRRW